VKTAHFAVDEWESKHPLAKPYPAEWIEDRWRPLAETLEIIRGAVGVTISVTPNGGYRSPAHNKAIGGRQFSQHMQGRAADIKAGGAVSAEKLHATIARLWANGKLPRLGGLGLYPTFVHVDVRANAMGTKLAQWNEAKTSKQLA